MSILGTPGSKVILLGNEAIARGAIEAGIGVAAAYPGTPSTEIVETLANVARDIGLYVEWSVNEKVAFEVAYGAAMCGIRALVAMKHVGVNVAKDTLMSSAYTGVKGGFVIVSADDPSCHSSQNEQDNRILGFHAYIPIFEPYSPGEAKELTRFLFNFSEKFESPVILRTTTRISHARGVVVLCEPEKPKVKGYFSKEDVERWILVPVNARRQRNILIEKWNRIKREVDNLTDFNILHYNSSRKTIIASGLAYSYVYEVLSDSNLLEKVNLLKISSVIPIPNGLTKRALEDVDSVLVVEELEPVVELQVKNLIVDNGLSVKVYGKNLIPLAGELTLERTAKAIGKFLDTQLSITTSVGRSVEFKVPPRPPTFCPGCPHRATYYALKRVIRSLNVRAVYLGDIGCYTLGYLPPFKLLDTCICMGASIGIACGVSKAVSGDTLVVALIGDSTFYHAGIPPLVNALYNRAPMLILIFDNLWTAMTGHQPHPGTGVNATGGKARVIPIEDIVKTMGVDYVRVVNSYNIVELERALREAIECVRRGGVAVIISRGECRLVTLRRLRRRGVRTPVFYVDLNLCTKCYLCVNEFMCPAIQVDVESKNVVIDPILCTGCGVCVHICPNKAINVKR